MNQIAVILLVSGLISTRPSHLALGSVNAQENASQSNMTNNRWLPETSTVRGVNLGSQFIIEPWMAYDEFSSMGCGELQDETSCVSKLGQETADVVFARHWDTWTTQDDIAKIVKFGLNVIRIPVGFWMREDLVHAWEHFPRGGLAYLDRLVGWAADAGLYVIIDLHGAPGSQAQDQQFTGYVGFSISAIGSTDPYHRRRCVLASTTYTTTKELFNSLNG